MKFADISGRRFEANPGLSAKCPSCGSDVVAKCGNLRVWHWAHRGVRSCDPWWESETEWHRGWKNKFPISWQEIIQTAPNGERHVADVKTDAGMVIEFQHSFLQPEERIARETFYKKMVWVVDGSRRKRDITQLLKSIGPRVCGQPPFILHVADIEGCALLRDWKDCGVPVYFDLGSQQDGAPIFWRMDPISNNSRAYLTPVSQDSFINVHLKGMNAEAIFSEGVTVIVERLRLAARSSQPIQPYIPYLRRAKRRGFRRPL